MEAMHIKDPERAAAIERAAIEVCSSSLGSTSHTAVPVTIAAITGLETLRTLVRARALAFPSVADAKNREQTVDQAGDLITRCHQAHARSGLAPTLQTVTDMTVRLKQYLGPAEGVDEESSHGLDVE